MLKYHLTTYGCLMNKSDSERINSLLEKNNFIATALNKADLAIFNLCSIRQSAIDRVWGKINQLKKQKNKPQIILSGCILPADKKKFTSQVDLILNITDLPNWPEKIKQVYTDQACPQLEYFSIQPKNQSSFSAYLPIMTGCNNFCSYCAVPYVRGREQSRPAQDIYNELYTLIKQGYKDIILLGQNVNSYKNPTTKITFPQLLKKIDAIPGNYWLNFFSSHPKDLSPQLIKAYTTLKHLTPYLHLPLQSGSDKILKLMQRRYTVAQYTKLIKQLKKTNPPIVITTDIIVGFPNETKQNFNQTKKVMAALKFDMAYISQYSPRPGIQAAALKDNIYKIEKKRRHKELTNILVKTSLEKNKKMINQILDVLIESSKANYLWAKTNQLKHVKIKSSQTKLIGQFVKVKITHATAWHLTGKLISK